MNIVYITLSGEKQLAIHNRYYHTLVKVGKKIGLKKLACRLAGTKNNLSWHREFEAKTNK